MNAESIEQAVGDRPTWSWRIYDPGQDNDLSAATVVLNMWDSSDALTITNGSCTIQPGKTFTADATTDKLTAVGHGLQVGYEVVVSNSGGALPTGLAAATRYFVREATPNTFNLSLEPSGEIINITAAGTGTHTVKIIGHVTYVPEAVDVDAAGTFRAKLKKTAGGLATTYPNEKEQFIPIIIGALPS